MKNKKKLSAFIAAALALTVAVGTWAYFTSSSTVTNKLSTNSYSNTTTEVFKPSTDNGWEPGQTVTKEVGVTNTGDGPLVVRVKMTEKWLRGGTAFMTINSTDGTKFTTVKQNDPKDGKTNGDDTVVTKAIDNTKWADGGDGYWYYKSQLTPNASTNSLLTAITLNSATDMGVYETVRYYHEGDDDSKPRFGPEDADNQGKDQFTGWKAFADEVPAPANEGNNIYVCSISRLKSGYEGYAAADYELIITTETCQATAAAVAEVWENAPDSVVTGWGLN